MSWSKEFRVLCLVGHEGRLALESWALLKAQTSVPPAHCGRAAMVTVTVKGGSTSPHRCLECPIPFILFFKADTSSSPSGCSAYPDPSPRGANSPHLDTVSTLHSQSISHARHKVGSTCSALTSDLLCLAQYLTGIQQALHKCVLK